MSLDEQLRRAFDTLAQRLAEDISRHLTTTADTVRSAADGACTAAAAEAAQQAWAAGEQAAVDRAAALAGEQAQASLRRLLAAMREMDEGESLREILGSLVSNAREDADRAAVVLFDGSGGFQIECSSGFDVPASGEVDPVDLFGGGTALVQAARSGDAIVSDGEGAFGAAAAVPLTMSKRVVGVLYAERGEIAQGSAASWGARLEVLTRHAARSLEAVTAMKLAAATTGPRGMSQ